MREKKTDIVKVDRQGQGNSVAGRRQHQGKAASASSADYHRRTIARIADICLGRGRGSNRRLVGRGEGGQQGGAGTATAARGTVTICTAPTGMTMAAIGIVTIAIGTSVAAIREAKTALGALPTGTIATG